MNDQSKDTDNKIVFKEESYQIQGAIFEVYREMGPGFLESVYQECLAMEFSQRQVPFRAQPPLSLHYKNNPLEQKYCPDFVCFECIIVEIKAVSELSPVHDAQIMNYLKGTNMRLGLLVNFGSSPKVTVRRFAH